MSSRARQLVVLFDGGCPMCRRTVRTLRSIDWLGRLQYADATDAATRQRLAPGLTEEAVMVQMYVLDEHGGRHAGYDGFLQIARVVPLLWPVRLIGVLPGVRWLGHRIYGVIAANRIRRGRCTDDLCTPAASLRRP